MKHTKLDALAEGCNNGACNMRGLLHSLNLAAIEHGELPSNDTIHPLRDHPAMPVIFGHLSYLCGDHLGPSPAFLARFTEHLASLE